VSGICWSDAAARMTGPPERWNVIAAAQMKLCFYLRGYAKAKLSTRRKTPDTIIGAAFDCAFRCLSILQVVLCFASRSMILVNDKDAATSNAPPRRNMKAASARVNKVRY